MIVDTILWPISVIMFFLMMAIMGGGLIVRELRHPTFVYRPWYILKTRIAGWSVASLILGSTTGFLFISPTDGWAEIIIEALAFGLMVAVAEVIAAGLYFRWRSARNL